jgi:hypothetical protein
MQCAGRQLRPLTRAGSSTLATMVLWELSGQRLSGADGKVALRDRDRDGVPIAAGGRGRRGTDGQRGGRRSRKYKYDSASCEA